MAAYEYFNGYVRDFEKKSEDFTLNISGKETVKMCKTLNITLGTLKSILREIQVINNMLSELRKMPNIFKEEAVDNEYIKKFIEKRIKLINSLVAERDKLFETYCKQCEVCGKQISKLKSLIKDEDERIEFHEKSKSLSILLYLAVHEPQNIPYKQVTDKLDSVKIHDLEKNKKLNERSSNSEKKEMDELYSELSRLQEQLAKTEDTEMKGKITREVLQIKKVLPPKKIAVSKETIEKLRKSSDMKETLDYVCDIMSGIYSILESKKINKAIDELKMLVNEARKKEERISESLSDQKYEDQSKIEYATKAVKEYRTIMSDNLELDRLKSQVVTTSDVKRRVSEMNTEVDEIRKKLQEAKRKSNETYQDYKEISELKEKLEHEENVAFQKESHLMDDLSKETITMLPEQYVNMKKKLQSMSSLYNGNIVTAEGRGR